MLELDQFRHVYFQECEDLLGSLEVQLIALQEGAEADDVIQEAFRAIHSVKGGAGALQFRRIAHSHTISKPCSTRSAAARSPLRLIW